MIEIDDGHMVGPFDYLIAWSAWDRCLGELANVPDLRVAVTVFRAFRRLKDMRRGQRYEA